MSSRLTWVLAVAALMCNRPAISELEYPRATSCRTSRSRSVKASREPGAARAGSSRAVKASMSRRVTVGHLTGRQNLRILAAARGEGAENQIGPALDRTGLTSRAGDRVCSYSMGMRQRLGLAACLLADPQLLILDEPMNGLDPAGMADMRDMLRGLVEEGRTVVLSSHLLDEVERTCDAVAIVDHGQVIRQGPIHELTRGVGVVVEVQCSDPPAAARTLGQSRIASRVAVGEDGLNVTLPAVSPAGPAREQAAEITRRLVEAGISVYGLRQIHTSLEDWFLSVTSRLEENQ
jgi:ABC-2 type transport system ATP-binding protein